jgi:hypothetical protein
VHLLADATDEAIIDNRGKRLCTVYGQMLERCMVSKTRMRGDDRVKVFDPAASTSARVLVE